MDMKNWIKKAIENERDRQHDKWGGLHQWGCGDCSSVEVEDSVKAMVLGEKVGEVNRALLELEHENLRVELIHVAAVAVAWLEGMGE